MHVMTPYINYPRGCSIDKKEKSCRYVLNDGEEGSKVLRYAMWCIAWSKTFAITKKQYIGFSS